MLRQVSSRNNRSKGLKVKSALQLFLLSAVTIWLLYQFKHSYDQKKSYDENKEKSASSIKNELSNTPGEEPIRFGRKDIPGAEIEQKGKISTRRVTKISERDTNLDETYGDEEIAEIVEEAEAEGTDESEKDELEKDEGDTDTEETSLLEDEETGKDELSEARERSFHDDNVASAVAHDINTTSWHEDYLESKNRNSTNAVVNTKSSEPGLVIGSSVKNRTENITGSLGRLKDRPISVNLTNGIVVTLNESGTGSSTGNSTSDLDSVVGENEHKVNITLVSGSNSIKPVGMNGTGISLNPVSKVDEREDDSHIEIKGTNDRNVILE